MGNHYCEEEGVEGCTGRVLAVAQMAEGWATANPPPVGAIMPNDTICDSNATCKGKYPEPYAYIKNVLFSQSLPEWEKRILNGTGNYSFPRKLVARWFDYNTSIEEDLDYNTAEDCLLHIGNLDQLWEWGSLFD